MKIENGRRSASRPAFLNDKWSAQIFEDLK
jgi:hypothetical protein